MLFVMMWKINSSSSSSSVTQIWVFAHKTGYNSAGIGDMSQVRVPKWVFEVSQFHGVIQIGP